MVAAFKEWLRGWWEDIGPGLLVLAFSAVAALAVAWMVRYPPDQP